MAVRVLENREPHGTLVKTPAERKTYGISVKNQFITMENKWRETKKILRVTGVGLSTKIDI